VSRTPSGIYAVLAALGLGNESRPAPLQLQMTNNPVIRGHSTVGSPQPAGAKIRRAMAAKQFGLRYKGRM